MQWVAAAWTSRAWTHDAVIIDHVYTFNAPGITNNSFIVPSLLTYTDKFLPKRALKVTHTIPLGDLVSMAGEKYIPGDVVTALWSEPGLAALAKKHTRPVYVPSIQGGDTRATGIVFGSLTHTQLSAFTYLHNDPDYRENIRTVMLASAAVGRLVNVVIPGSGLLFQVVPLALLTRGTTEAINLVAASWGASCEHGEHPRRQYQADLEISSVHIQSHVHDELAARRTAVHRQARVRVHLA